MGGRKDHGSVLFRLSEAQRLPVQLIPPVLSSLLSNWYALMNFMSVLVSAQSFAQLKLKFWIGFSFAWCIFGRETGDFSVRAKLVRV